MSTHIGRALIYVVARLLMCVGGGLIVRYPEVSYAIRTGWKHDDSTLSSRGRTDQRVMGGVVFLIGIGLLLHGF